MCFWRSCCCAYLGVKLGGFTFALFLGWRSQGGFYLRRKEFDRMSELGKLFFFGFLRCNRRLLGRLKRLGGVCGLCCLWRGFLLVLWGLLG